MKEYPNPEVVEYPNDKIGEAFILSYDTEFGRELNRKLNEKFKRTPIEMPLEDAHGEVAGINMLRRLALTSTIHDDPQLRSQGLWPITPEHSEYLLLKGRLPGIKRCPLYRDVYGSPHSYFEPLALILYDVDEGGANPEEARSLQKELRRSRRDLHLEERDLEKSLLIVNAGLKKDSKMPNGVKPIILPDITEVSPHEILERKVTSFRDYDFKYGLNGGLPSRYGMGKSHGKRKIWLPHENHSRGLRVLTRDGLDYLYADDEELGGLAGGCRACFSDEKVTLHKFERK